MHEVKYPLIRPLKLVILLPVTNNICAFQTYFLLKCLTN